MKKILCIIILNSLLLYPQQKNDEQILKEAFDKFSKSPFNSLLISGGAFYSGDDLDQVPVLVNYFKNGNSKNMTIVDGLLGSLIMDAKVVQNNLNLYVVDNGEETIQRNFDTFALDAPIMRFPKAYANAIDYKFIDLEKKIISSNITIGKNWHTLKVGYRDRVDTIVFSATSFRVRSISINYMNNVIDLKLGQYTNINDIPYPTEFILTSKVDKREIRFNITNVSIENRAKQGAKQLGW